MTFHTNSIKLLSDSSFCKIKSYILPDRKSLNLQFHVTLNWVTTEAPSNLETSAVNIPPGHAEQSRQTLPTAALDRARAQTRHGHPLRHLALQRQVRDLFLLAGAEPARRHDLRADRTRLRDDAPDYRSLALRRRADAAARSE